MAVLRSTFLLFCILWIPIAGRADDIPPTLTLDYAIGLALEQNPRVWEADAEQAITQAGVARAHASFLPTLQVQEVYTRTNDPIGVFGTKLSQGRFSAQDFSVATLTNPTAVSNFHSTVSLSQSLYAGGRTSAALAQARLQHEASRSRSHRQRQEVIFATTSRYYQVLLAQRKIVVLSAALATAQEITRVAQQRFDNGLVVKADVLSAAVRLATLNEQQIGATQQLALAQARLNETMGASLDAAWSIDDRLVRCSGTLSTVADLEQQALAHRPDYQQLAFDEQAQHHAMSQARAAFLPTIRAVASYDLHHPNFPARGRDNWSVGVVAQWNLFNGGADAAGVAEATAGLRRMQALRTQAANRIKLEVREARATLHGARERSTVAEQAVTQAEAALQIATDRYQAGLSAFSDVLAREEALTHTRSTLSEALYDCSVGWTQVELASGTLGRTATIDP